MYYDEIVHAWLPEDDSFQYDDSYDDDDDDEWVPELMEKFYDLTEETYKEHKKGKISKERNYID